MEVGRELDSAVAERVMGWQRQHNYNYWMTFPDGSFELHALIATWKPSTDLGTAMQVEDRIAELGLKHEYMRELTAIVAEVATQEDRLIEHFDWVHATAEQRCRAALATTQKEHDDKR